MILVENANFQESVAIVGKSLTLQGFGNASLFLPPEGVAGEALLEVRDLSASQEVHFRGISLIRVTGLAGHAVHVEDCDGPVWLEEVFLDTYDGHGVVVEGSGHVVLSELFIQSNAAHRDEFGDVQPSHGLIVDGGSRVHALQTSASGSHTPPLFSVNPLPSVGGSGAVVQDSFLQLHGGDLQGGGGGTFLIDDCLTAAAGGAALEIRANGGPAPEVTLLGTQVQAGHTGTSDALCAQQPPAAPAIVDPGNALLVLPGTPRLLSLPALPYPNGAFELQVQGEPGEVFLLFASGGIVPSASLPGVYGLNFLDPSDLFLAGIGSIDSLGFGGLVDTFENTGPPVTIRAQAILVDGSGQLHLSDPGTILFQ